MEVHVGGENGRKAKKGVSSLGRVLNNMPKFLEVSVEE